MARSWNTLADTLDLEAGLFAGAFPTRLEIAAWLDQHPADAAWRWFGDTITHMPGAMRMSLAFALIAGGTAADHVGEHAPLGVVGREQAGRHLGAERHGGAAGTRRRHASAGSSR